MEWHHEHHSSLMAIKLRVRISSRVSTIPTDLNSGIRQDDCELSACQHPNPISNRWKSLFASLRRRLLQQLWVVFNGFQRKFWETSQETSAAAIIWVFRASTTCARWDRSKAQRCLHWPPMPCNRWKGLIRAAGSPRFDEPFGGRKWTLRYAKCGQSTLG